MSSCIIEIDPRKTAVYDSCINCGECVDACNRMHQKADLPGLLTFKFGEPKAQTQARSRFRDNATSIVARGKWLLALGAVGACLFTWGLHTWEPLHVVVYRAEVQHQRNNLDYRIAISNKLYRTRSVKVGVIGLSAAGYKLSSTEVTLPAAGHESVVLSLSDKLSHGVHPFAVEVTAPGWRVQFPILHLAE